MFKGFATVSTRSVPPPGFPPTTRHVYISVVLAALNIGAVLVAVAAGGLAASLIGLVVGGTLSIAGLEAGADIGLVVGILVGLATGGWVAGIRAAHSHRFHGMVTGLGLAFMILVIARFGGSPAPTSQVVWLAVIAVTVSGLTGWLAGRRKTRGIGG